MFRVIGVPMRSLLEQQQQAACVSPDLCSFPNHGKSCNTTTTNTRHPRSLRAIDAHWGGGEQIKDPSQANLVNYCPLCVILQAV